MSTLLYLEHLSDTDLAILVAAAGDGKTVEDLLTDLRANPDYLADLLQRPAVFAALFGSGEREALLRGSPFLAFAVLVHRVAQDLTGLRFVEEWVAPGRRVPMFEVAGLQEFASDSLRRLFLAELLASYTKVASGSVWVQTARGWRRRRFSELDPLRLVELIPTLPEPERPALYRRLGDLALFLTGVFPDYAGGRLLPPLKRLRLERTLGSGEIGKTAPVGQASTVWLLEELGRRSYRLAWQAAAGYGTMPRVLDDVAQGFGEARRVLNVLTDRYLFPHREEWFPLG